MPGRTRRERRHDDPTVPDRRYLGDAPGPSGRQTPAEPQRLRSRCVRRRCSRPTVRADLRRRCRSPALVWGVAARASCGCITDVARVLLGGHAVHHPAGRGRRRPGRAGAAGPALPAQPVVAAARAALPPAVPRPGDAAPPGGRRRGHAARPAALAGAAGCAALVTLTWWLVRRRARGDGHRAAVAGAAGHAGLHGGARLGRPRAGAALAPAGRHGGRRGGAADPGRAALGRAGRCRGMGNRGAQGGTAP